MAEKVTYNSLLKDDAFLNDARYALLAQGINVSTKRGDILDRFLTNKRYFDTNLVSTLNIGDTIKDMSDKDKMSYAKAVTKLEQLPTYGKGAAPAVKKVKDYLIAGVTDPTNLVSAIAGAFTFGTGTAAIQGGKEAARLAAKKVLQAKTRALLGKENLKNTAKAALVEGTIAGVGGGAQNLLAQDVDMELGRREKGDYDLAKAGQQALIEGVASPLFGIGLNVTGRGIKKGVTKAGEVSYDLTKSAINSRVAKELGNTTVVKRVGNNKLTRGIKSLTDSAIEAGVNTAQQLNYFKNYFLPNAGLDAVTTRNVERAEGASRGIKNDSEKIINDLEAAESNFVKTESDQDLLNTAMEGVEFAPTKEISELAAFDALKEIKVRDPKMAEAVESFLELRKKAQKLAIEENQGQSNLLKEVLERNPQYTKKYYENFGGAFGGIKPDKAAWKKYDADMELIGKLQDKALVDKNLQVQLGIRDGELDKDLTVKTAGDIKDKFKVTGEGGARMPDLERQRIRAHVEDYVYQRRYQSKEPAKLGGLKGRKKFDPILQKIWGVNANAAVRASTTIESILEAATEARLANSVTKSALGRKIGVKAVDAVEAARLSKEQSVKDIDTLFKRGDITEQQRIDALQKLDETVETFVPLVGNVGSKDAGFVMRRKDIYDPALGQVFVPKNFADKLKILTNKEGVADLPGLGFLRLFSAVNGYLKKNITVYNPFGQLRNFMGVFQYAAAAGNLRGMGSYASKIVRGTKEEKANFKKVAESIGVTASSVELNQILTRLEDAKKITGNKDAKSFLADSVLAFTSFGTSLIEKTKFGKSISRGAEKAYTGSDDFGKLMTLTGELDKANSIFKDSSPVEQNLKRENFAEGFGYIDKDGNVEVPTDPKLLKEFDDAMLLEEAAQKTLDIIPVYSRVPKILEKGRDIPVVGAFTAFPAENARNKYNILKLGAQEIKEGFEKNNKSLILAGKNRLFSQMTMAGLPTASAYVYNQVMGTDKVEPGVRATSSPWQKYHALLIRPKGKDKDGEDKFGVTDLSYNNPDQYILDMIMPLMITAARGEDVEKKLDELFPVVFENTYSPFLDLTMGAQLGKQFLQYAKARNPEEGSTALRGLYKTLEPGYFKLLTDVAGSAGANQAMNILSEKLGGSGTTGSDIQNLLTPLYYGDKREYLRNTSSTAEYLTELGLNPANRGNLFAWALYPFSVGIKEIDYQPVKQIGFAVNTLMRNANNDVRDKKTSIKNKLSSGDRVSLVDLGSQWNDVLQEEFVAQQGLYETIQRLRQFMPERKIFNILNSKKIKTAGGFSTKDINNILKGEFSPSELDDKFFVDIDNANAKIRKDLGKVKKVFKDINSYYNFKNLQEANMPDLKIGD